MQICLKISSELIPEHSMCKRTPEDSVGIWTACVCLCRWRAGVIGQTSASASNTLRPLPLHSAIIGHTYAFVSGLSFLHVSAVRKWLWEMNSDKIVMESECGNMGWWRDDRCVNYPRDGGNDAVMPPSVSVCRPAETQIHHWGFEEGPMCVTRDWLAVCSVGRPSFLSCKMTGSVMQDLFAYVWESPRLGCCQ